MEMTSLKNLISMRENSIAKLFKRCSVCHRLSLKNSSIERSWVHQLYSKTYLTNFNVNSMNEIIPQLFYKIIKMNFMYYRLHLSKEKSRHLLPLTRCSISFIQVKQSGIESCSKQETYIVLLKMNAKKMSGNQKNINKPLKKQKEHK